VPRPPANTKFLFSTVTIIPNHNFISWNVDTGMHTHTQPTDKPDHRLKVPCYSRLASNLSVTDNLTEETADELYTNQLIHDVFIIKQEVWQLATIFIPLYNITHNYTVSQLKWHKNSNLHKQNITQQSLISFLTKLFTIYLTSTVLKSSTWKLKFPTL